MPKEYVKTFCRNCQGHCGMEVQVADGKILGVRGDKDHPLTRGYLCVKGLSSADFHNGSGVDPRLTESRKRLSDGTFIDIDVEVAMDEIAASLGDIIRRHGPASVAFWSGTASYMGSNILTTQGLIKSLMSELGTPYLFSGMTLDQSAKWVTMLRMGAFATGKRLSHELDVLMLVGANPLVSHQGNPLNSASPWNPGVALREARSNGAKLIVVDPRRTETARMADLHLQIIPGQDAALMAALIKLILDNRSHDSAFCERFVDHLDALHQAVAPWELDAAARRTGLAQDAIVRAAELLGGGKRISVGSGTGSNMAPNANLSEHLTEALNAICGGYRRVGEFLATPGLVNRNLARERVFPPSRHWLQGPRLSGENAGSLMGEFPSALLPQSILEGQIKALIVLGGNPAMAIGNPGKTRAALKALDCLVAVDPRMTETGRLAHYVIAPALPFERHDVPILIESWAPKPFLQYAPPILEKPKGVLEDWEFLWGLAQRLGIQLTLKRVPYGADYASIPGGLVLDMSQKPDVESLLEWALADSPISYPALKKVPGAISPDISRVVIAEVDEDDHARLDLLPEDVLQELHEFEKEPAPGPYRYLLCCRRLMENMNSAFRLSERSRRRHGSGRVFMHPDDIAEAGLTDGEGVVVQSRHGSIPGLLAVDKTQRPGVVSMTHHWAASDGSTDGHTAGLVSIEPASLSTISYMTRQSAIPVNIVAANGSAQRVDHLASEARRERDVLGN